MAKHPTIPPGDLDKIEAKARQYLAYAKEQLPKRARAGRVTVVDDFIMAVRTELLPYTHETRNSIDEHARTRARRLVVYETLRRCDLALIRAIRAAQDKGIMAKRGDNSPHQVTLRNLRSGCPPATVWALENVTDGAYEVALNTCRDAKIMTRVAVVRALRGDPPYVPRAIRGTEKILDAATQRRAYSGAVTVMAGLADGLRNLGEVNSSISEGERATWLHELQRHRSVLSSAMNLLMPQEWRDKKAAIGRKAASVRRQNNRQRQQSPS